MRAPHTLTLALSLSRIHIKTTNYKHNNKLSKILNCNVCARARSSRPKHMNESCEMAIKLIIATIVIIIIIRSIKHSFFYYYGVRTQLLYTSCFYVCLNHNISSNGNLCTYIYFRFKKMPIFSIFMQCDFS